MERRLAAILVADVVGFSTMMESDETKTLENLKAMRTETFDPIVNMHGGRIFKNTGDGALVEFGSAFEAVQAAVEIQRKLGLKNAAAGQSNQITLRVGINLGDIIVDNNDLYGNGVNVAARMENLAKPGEICISENVHVHVANTMDATFLDLGNQEVKGLDKPIRSYRLVIDVDITAEYAKKTSDRRLIPPEKPSIAVLPFQNMSGDPEQEFFADGMAEDIITALSRYRSLFVIARNSSFSYKGQSPDLREVSKDLGVRYVLEGSVRKSDSKIRITGQLIEGSTGNHIWAQRYDRGITDLFSVQDEITEAIVAGIAPEIDQVERNRAKRLPPESLDTWESYQKGLWHLYKFNKDDNFAAQALFREADSKSENFSQAKSGLTHALYYTYMHGYSDDSKSVLKEALKIGREAISFDDRDPDSHFALGRILYLNQDIDSSKAEFELAINFNPSFAHAHFGLGTALLFEGEWEASINSVDNAIRLSPYDPLLWIMYTVKAIALFGLDQLGDAEKMALQATRQPTPEFTAFMILATVQENIGAQIEGQRSLNKILEMRPDLSASHLEQILPFRDKDFLTQIIASLKRLGFEC